MKRVHILVILFIGFFAFLSANGQQTHSIIIDHTNTDLEDIPAYWLEQAKSNLHIGYGHTSHGSQISSGMNALMSYFTDGRYNWSRTERTAHLHLFEGSGYNEGFLGLDCGYEGWDEKTKVYLNANPACNVIMWSWCGQVNDVDLNSHYFSRMAQLESEFPNVKFVYMTGHLEGQGPSGSLFKANQKIRDYCRDNNKILFDFADIEKYCPDGDINYDELYADDECNYQKPGGGTGNWATEWLQANPEHILTKISAKCGSCAHSISLNCVRKGIAVWQLWCRLAGWDGIVSALDGESELVSFDVFPNPLCDDYINIKLPRLSSNNCIVRIMDIHSRIMTEYIVNIEDKELCVDVSGYTQGVYFILYITDGKIEHRKIAIRR